MAIHLGSDRYSSPLIGSGNGEPPISTYGAVGETPSREVGRPAERKVNREEIAAECPPALHWLEVCACLGPFPVPNAWLEEYLKQERIRLEEKTAIEEALLQFVTNEDGGYVVKGLDLGEYKTPAALRSASKIVLSIRENRDPRDFDDWEVLYPWSHHARFLLGKSVFEPLEEAAVRTTLGSMHLVDSKEMLDKAEELYSRYNPRSLEHANCLEAMGNELMASPCRWRLFRRSILPPIDCNTDLR